MKELINNLEELNRKAEKGGGDARIEPIGVPISVWKSRNLPETG